jgi:hypothetical protein
MTVYFMVFPGSPALVRYAPIQVQDIQEDQEGFEAFEASKSGAAGHRQDRTRSARAGLQEQDFRSASSLSGLRVTGSRRSK